MELDRTPRLDRYERERPDRTRAAPRASGARSRPRPLERYLTTVVLSAHVASLGPVAGAELVAAVAERMPTPVIDYVRVELVARRGG